MADAANVSSRHVMAVIGGATAGSEIARILAGYGALVIVFEQNPRPYGKIEDGLPRWHVKQRHDEYEEINKRLDHPNIEYVPLTGMGRDIDFEALRTRWGVSGIVLTNGAWKDRPLPIDGADQYIDRGLVYQNKLIYWWNHYPEKSYDGPRYELTPGALIVGGGLASIDVVKVVQIEYALAGLKARGIQGDMLELEREGIEPVLNAKGLKYADLGIPPCRLYYRRRVIDMPLSDIPADTPQKRADALRQARVKIVDKAQRKFLFEFHELRAPGKVIAENGAMVGLNFNRTEVTGSQVRTVEEGVEDARAKLDDQFDRKHPATDSWNSAEGRDLYLRRSEDRPADGRSDGGLCGRKRVDRQGQHQGFARERNGDWTARGRGIPGIVGREIEPRRGRAQRGGGLGGEDRGRDERAAETWAGLRRGPSAPGARTPARGRLRGQFPRVARQGDAGRSAVAGCR